MNNKNTNNTYEAEVICKNCGLDKKIKISKGKKIEEQPCPDCGCRELTKKPKTIIMRPHIDNYR